MERGMEIGETTLALPTGAQEIIIGIIMILVLILRPAGLTGGRELRLRIGGR
jgi:branched-chain amino acid transport system permease protein